MRAKGQTDGQLRVVAAPRWEHGSGAATGTGSGQARRGQIRLMSFLLEMSRQAKGARDRPHGTEKPAAASPCFEHPADLGAPRGDRAPFGDTGTAWHAARGHCRVRARWSWPGLLVDLHEVHASTRGCCPARSPKIGGISATPSCSVLRAPSEGRRPWVPSRVQIRREASGAGLALAQRKQPVNFHWCCSELISSLRDPRQRRLPGVRRNYLGKPRAAAGGDGDPGGRRRRQSHTSLMQTWCPQGGGR